MSAAPTAPVTAPETRLHSLDGLRGLAAVFVVAFHVLPHVALPGSLVSLWLASPLGVVVNGPGAVHVFFVLSGYVLALTLARDAGPAGTARFYVRRVFRIHPPYVAAVLLAWLATLDQPLGVPHAAPEGACRQLPAALLPRALALPSMAFGLLPPGWSLFVELLMSGVFPLLLWTGRRLHPLAPVALGVLLLRAPAPSLHFLVFTWDFALGIALHAGHERAARALGALGPPAAAAWALAACALLQAPYALSLRAAARAGLDEGHTPAVIVLMGLGSALLVAGALHAPPLRRALSTPTARFLGRVSYSLYLVHFVVLSQIVCRVTGPRLSWPQGLLVFGVVLALSLALAALGWRWVEAPSIRAGRALIRAGGRLAGGARRAR